MVTRIR